MLLELADELAGDLATEELEALENILLARRDGLHLLAGSDAVFAALVGADGLGRRERKILEKSRGKQFQKKALFQTVQRRVLVTRDRGPSLERDGDQEIAIVPLRHFAPYGAADRAVVLGEGEPDARMAVRMARYFAHTNRSLEQIALRPRVAVGGGQGTSGAMRRYREEPRFCIGVVDSDRAAPGCEEGRTATKARREVDAAKPWVGLHVIACRMMENTLPRGLIEAAFGGDHQKRGPLDDLERFEEDGTLARYREYCDFKKGTRLKWVFDRPEDARRFWLAPEAPLTAAPSVDEGCLARQVCAREDGSCAREDGSCACVVALGFGQPLLERCVDAAEKMPDQELQDLLCEKTEPHWRALGRTVFSWVCGTGKTIV